MKKLTSLLFTLALILSLNLTVGAAVESASAMPENPASPANPLTGFGEIEEKAFTSTDALNILKAAVGSISLSDSDFVRYDLNKDGKIDTTDAIMALRLAVGLSAQAPATPIAPISTSAPVSEAEPATSSSAVASQLQKLQAANTQHMTDDGSRWYGNERGFVKLVVKSDGTPDRFQIFNYEGKREWNCDWSVQKSGDSWVYTMVVEEYFGQATVTFDDKSFTVIGAPVTDLGGINSTFGRIK